MKTIRNFLDNINCNEFAGMLVFMAMVLFAAVTVLAAEKKSVVEDKAEMQTEQTKVVQPEVEAKTDDEVTDKRQKIIKEATEAIAQTKNALKALEDGKNDVALKALEVATGKLALIVARSPELALAPLDVGIITHDLYAQVETVKERIELAEKLLGDGMVQNARALLGGLASEMRIRTTHLPLATYPEAIKAIVPLIDKGNVEEAKRDLQLALNTLVLTDKVIPLPILRAQALLKKGEELAENEDRTIKQNDELAKMLDAARTQIALAEALGYGQKRQYKPILNQITEIEKKTQGGKSGEGFFDKIKDRLAEF